MYGLKYKVPFTDVDENDYEVRILVDGYSGDVTELTGAESPFVVDVSDEQFLYTPTRFSGATLNIVGSDYLQDLFSTDYQMSKVDLYKGSRLMWTGFITPDTYSQEYDAHIFELGIECISALSTLEYVDFSMTQATPTFKEILLECINKSKGSYTNVYIPNTYNIDLSELSVSRANFFDEDDKPMTLKECLEEVCKYLGWTCTDMNGYVCFVDVDYISRGFTEYTDLLTGKVVNLSSNIDVASIVSKDSANTMSMIGGYNKVTVVDSDYEPDQDFLFPELDKVKGDPLGSTQRAASKDGSYIMRDDNGKSKYGDIRYYYRFFTSPKVKLTRYNYSNGNWVVDNSDSLTSAGARLLYQATADQEDKPISLNWEPIYEIKLFDGLDSPEVNYLEKDNYLYEGSGDKTQCFNFRRYRPTNWNTYLDGYHIEPVNNTISNISGLLKKTIEYESPAHIIFPNNSCIGISYKMLLTPLKPNIANDNYGKYTIVNAFRGIPYDLSVDKRLDNLMTLEKILKENDHYKNSFNIDEHKNYYFIPMRLQIGNMYWNGSDWTRDSNSVFRVNVDVEKDTKLLCNWLKSKNTNSYEESIDGIDEAYVIPLFNGLNGKVKLTLFVPYFEMPWQSKNNIYIKDLKIKVGRSTSFWDLDKNENKKDTKYTNVVNDKFVNEAEDVELKLTSDNESVLSLSKVAFNNEVIKILSSKLFDKAMLPEKQIINRIVNQYNKPKVSLLYNVENSIDAYSLLSNKYMSGKKFIYTGGQIDYASNSIECNMIELF